MIKKVDELAIFWFRRDLRLEDNAGLWHALSSGFRVLPVFIFDTNILEKLENDDPRVQFIRESLEIINSKLKPSGKSLMTFYGPPVSVLKSLAENLSIKAVYSNSDYEPYGISGDAELSTFLGSLGIRFFSFKDHVVFEKSEILKSDGKPYTMFTPYSVKWKREFTPGMLKAYPSESLTGNLVSSGESGMNVSGLKGFRTSRLRVKPFDLRRETITSYSQNRNIPSADGGTYLGPHLRFGTVSIREVMRRTTGLSEVFTNELIWREFFMQILFHFPDVSENSFRPEYDRILWINNEEHFSRWCSGTTGYPLIDAGMRELSQSGYMHNRVRMVAASFLAKHLLTDWRWGEAWFASRLLDYELSSNNGNWQWAAGCGCDAAPYFRVFNPEIQLKKFDPEFKYVKKWVPEYGTKSYPAPVVDHKTAGDRAIRHYKRGITT